MYYIWYRRNLLQTKNEAVITMWEFKNYNDLVS